MTQEEQIQLGREIYRRGGSYKSCKNANTLKGYTLEERDTNCGFLHQAWNHTGQGQFGVRGKTIRNDSGDEGLAWRD